MTKNTLKLKKKKKIVMCTHTYTQCFQLAEKDQNKKFKNEQKHFKLKWRPLANV